MMHRALMMAVALCAAVPGAGSVSLAGERELPGLRSGSPRQIAKGVRGPLVSVIAAGRKKDGYLALWTDLRGAGQPAVLARRLDAGGKTFGKTVALGNGATPQISPGLASDGRSGDYLAVWIEQRGTVASVYARRISAAGALAGPESRLSEGENNNGPSVAWNPGAREYLVAWWTGAYDILARRVSEKGLPVGPVIRVCAEPGMQDKARVAYRAATGDYLVCWDDRRAGNDDIRCRAVQGDGSLPASEVAIREEAFPEILTDIVANGPEGEVLLLWEDYRHVSVPKQNATMGDHVVEMVRSPGNGADVYAQRLDQSGSPLGPEIPVCVAIANQLKARGVFLPLERRYLLVWQDGRTGYENWDIFGRFAGADGGLGAEFAVASPPREQFDPAVACQPDTSVCLVTWHGVGKQGNEIGVQSLGGKPRLEE